MRDETFKSELLWRAFTQFPYFHRGLEIGCKTGERIRVARRRGLNLYGVDPKDLRNAWGIQGVDLYIKVGELPNLPYEDELFDYVTHPKPVRVPDDQYLAALKEICRVGSRSFYMNLPLDEKKTMEWYLPMIIDAGFKIEAIQKSMGGNLVMEARKI